MPATGKAYLAVWADQHRGGMEIRRRFVDPLGMSNTAPTDTRPSKLKNRAMIALCGVLGIAAFIASPADARPKADGKFDVSGVGTNNEITKGPDGNIWVTL